MPVNAYLPPSFDEKSRKIYFLGVWGSGHMRFDGKRREKGQKAIKKENRKGKFVEKRNEENYAGRGVHRVVVYAEK